jgi:histone H3/H4
LYALLQRSMQQRIQYHPFQRLARGRQSLHL